MGKLNLFVPITKVDQARREVWGVAAEEVPDKTNEIFDYGTSKPRFEKWSNAIAKATDGKSVGNLRAMHQPIAAGKVIALNPDDDAKKIFVGAKVVDDAEWQKVEEGVYSGFSIGGNYAKRWKDGAYTRYTAEPTEISLVDNPAMFGATFEVVKADGVIEMRKFIVPKSAGDQATPETTDAKDDAGKSDLVTNLRKLAKCYAEPAQNWQWVPVVIEPPSEAKEEAMDVSTAMQVMTSLVFLAADEADKGESADAQLLIATVLQLWQFIQSEFAEIVKQAALSENPLSDGDGNSLMQMAVKLGELQKTGARNNAQDAERLQKIHDLAVANGARCASPRNDDQETEKAMKPDELKKLFDEWLAASKLAAAEDLQKIAGTITAPDTFSKMIGDAVAPLAKAEDVQKVVDQAGELSKRFDGIEGRLQALEKLPDPRLPVLRVVKRDGEPPANNADEARQLLEKLLENPALSEESKRDIRKGIALEEIKMTMQQGPRKIGG